MTRAEGTFNFSLLTSQSIQAAAPALESYSARDGSLLAFRRYAATTDVHLILIHGSSAHSEYLQRFAESLSQNNVANVYTPDLRGHGPNPERRGDIDDIGQLEEDLADLIQHLKLEAPGSSRFVVGGHSSGGGLALRFAGGNYSQLAQAVLLISPYVGHDAPMVKQNAGGWSSPKIVRIIALSILNSFGIKWFNAVKVLGFNLPEQYQTGIETLSYSYRMMVGLHPEDYRMSLKQTRGPVLILVGAEDEALDPGKFEAAVALHSQDVSFKLLEGIDHLGIVMSEEAIAETARWIQARL